MKLIIESGATKSDCCLVNGRGEVCRRFRVPGINVASMDAAAVSDVLGRVVAQVYDVGEVYFYGAGIVGSGSVSPGPASADPASAASASAASACPDSARALDEVLGSAFPGALREYHSDLLAAARGLCGRSAGVLAILGTGSNSCFYDGEKVVRNIRPGGFILGDEGSAAALGRMFISDYIKELQPADVYEDFRRNFGWDYASVVKMVYKSPAPSAQLASLAPYILGLAGLQDGRDGQNGHEGQNGRNALLQTEAGDYINNLVRENFRAFFERALVRYGCPNVYVTGSFGVACRELLVEMGRGYGLEFAGFAPAPMDGLVKYHSDVQK